jgi:hypothetical protein
MVVIRKLNMKQYKERPYELYRKFNTEVYGICRRNPKHTDPEVVYLKTHLIGRTYAVSPERIKDSKYKSKDFWREFCFHIVNSNIDKHLNRLKKIKSKKTLTEEEKFILIEVFNEVHSVFKSGSRSRDKKNNPNRISFTSKYLHFHFPHLFYIYDSLALKGIREKKKDIQYRGSSKKSVYETFYEKCEILRKKENFKDPRALDNYLLHGI